MFKHRNYFIACVSQQGTEGDFHGMNAQVYTVPLLGHFDSPLACTEYGLQNIPVNIFRFCKRL